MARMTIKAGDEYMTKLSYAGTGASAISKKAIFEGARIVADAIREAIKNLPEDRFRLLQKGEKFSGVPKEHKQALLDGLGIMRISEDKNGDHMTRIGWEGYAWTQRQQEVPKRTSFCAYSTLYKQGVHCQAQNPIREEGSTR